METSSANEKARAFMSTRWQDWDSRISLAPGKGILSKLNRVIQDKYGVTLTALELSSQVAGPEIDPEVNSVLDEISNL